MYIAVDLGGTKTLIVLFDEDRNIINQIKFETPKDPDQFVSELAKARTELTSETDFHYGVAGTRGNVDRRKGLLLMDDVILPWVNFPLREVCEETFGCKFSIENDSKLAGLSEAHEAGSEFNRVLYVTVSTGIGTALIVDGTLDLNSINSEAGKMVYEKDGHIVSWESFASGKAIFEKYGMRASDISDADSWQAISHNLALGLVNVATIFQPEVIIVGGGVGSHFHKFEQPLSALFGQMKSNQVRMPVFRQAQHAEEAVIYGGYLLAKQHHEAQQTA